MKCLIILALCLCAVLADDLEGRFHFHKLHHSLHQQTVEEAKRKVSDTLGTGIDGQTSFEEVGSYGSGTVGLGSSAGSLGASNAASFGANSGSSFGASNAASFDANSAASFGANNAASFGASSGASFGASHAANFGASSSSSFDTSANFESAAQSGSGLVGGSSSSFTDQTENLHQHVVPEVYIAGGAGGQNSYLRHEEHHTDSQASPIIYSAPSGGSEKYYHHEESRVSNQAATPIVYTAPARGSENYFHHEEHRVNSSPLVQITAPSGGSEKYVHHEERNVESRPTTYVQFAAPSGGSENYVHHEERRTENKIAPVHMVVSPSGGHESYIKYKKVTSSAQPQLYVTAPAGGSHLSLIHHSTSGSNTGSQLGAIVSGGYIPTTAIDTGYDISHHGSSGVGSAANLVSGSFADGSFDSHFGSQLQAQQKAQSHFGSSFGAESNFNSKFGSQFGGSSAIGVGSSNGIRTYMTEAERLAKLQAQGINVGGFRAGSSQFGQLNSNSGFESGLSGGYGGLAGSGIGGVSGSGISGAGGVSGGGYKTKQWEKASKWSSQSQFGSDGQVNNYKELSTGESENYDINGQRAGYKAATTTLDDNGKVSSYSLHT